VQLAAKRISRRFAGLDLAAWKLPEAALVLIIGASGQQDAPIPIQNHGRSNVKQTSV